MLDSGLDGTVKTWDATWPKPVAPQPDKRPTQGAMIGRARPRPTGKALAREESFPRALANRGLFCWRARARVASDSGDIGNG